MVHKNIFEKALMKLANRKFNIDLDNIKYNKETKSHEYVLSNGEVITFEMLSEHLIDQPKSMVKELESKERKGKCHSMSFGLGISIKDSIVHTGTITVGNRKVLHSVCEMKDKNGNIVFLDWTRNLHIDKDEYIKLFNFKILSSIKTEDILNDIKFLEHMSGLDMKTYLVFRDEMMKDLEKNEFLFEQDNESHNKTK